MAATIFERYGGFGTIRKVVSTFYDKVLDSPVVSHHFSGVDMRRLIEHQTVFIAFVTGGPSAGYGDDVLRRVHAPLGITAEEFSEMAALLREALEDLDFEAADVEYVDQQIQARQPLIVGALSPR